MNAADQFHTGIVVSDLEPAGGGPDGGRAWSYYRSPDGPRIELVSRSLEPLLAMMWT